MAEASVSETTQLLRRWTGGDEEALTQLVPHVYRELRRVAGHVLKNEPVGHSLQATDLVHEVYLKLIDIHQLDWKHRSHFFAVAATLMRRILVDRARRRIAAKRGGRARGVDIDKSPIAAPGPSRELVALDDSLNELAGIDGRKARVVELRFFAGLGVKESAEVIGVSPDTVMRDWRLARAWLSREMLRKQTPLPTDYSARLVAER